MPDAWLEDLTLVGTPTEVVEKIGRWLDAGVDSICIFLPDEELERATLRARRRGGHPGVPRDLSRHTRRRRWCLRLRETAAAGPSP